MDYNMQQYYDYTVSPLGKLFYKTVWKHLEYIKNKKVLDFGSGFGFTAQQMAQANVVTALETDASMIAAGEKWPNFEQIHGDLESLKNMPDASFDVVLCHLVFEFVENAPEILHELLRVLKKGGTLSVVRHNKPGRIIQVVLQDYDVAEVQRLLQGGYAYSGAFGDIKYYDTEELLQWSQQSLSLEAVHGVRSLASLHTEQMREQEGWLENMFTIEWELLKNPIFVQIAYFNHLILTKKMD